MRPICLVIVLFLAVSTTYAQRPDAPEYAQRGEYTVGTRELTISDADRPLNVTIWYPALNPDNLPEETVYQPGTLLQLNGRAISEALPNNTEGSFPLVIFSHGSSGFRFQSRYLTEHLASHGFVVMATDHPTNTISDLLANENFSDDLAPNYINRPQDILQVINLADRLTTEGEFASMIDTENIAVMGHSFGGYTALAVSGLPINLNELEDWCATVDPDDPNDLDGVCFLLNYEDSFLSAADLATAPEGAFPTYTDPRIQAVVAYAPWNGPIFDDDALANQTIPTMIFGGTADFTTQPVRDAFVIYEGLQNAPKTLITLENAGHYVYVDECWATAITFGFYDSCSDPVWDMARVHDLINHFTTAFLLAELKEDDTARTALAPENMHFVGLQYETANSD